MLVASKTKIGNEKKRVRFFGEPEYSINEQEEYPAVFSTQKLKISTMKKLWFAFSNNDKYEELKQYLEQCEQQGRTIEEFFLREGRLVLSLTMLKSSTGELGFICENISHNLVQNILRQNPYILEGFFLGQIGLEKHNRVTSDDLDLRMGKFELLLKMGVRDLLEMALSSIKQPKPEGVLKSFRGAVEKWEKKTSDILDDVPVAKRFKTKEVENPDEIHSVKLSGKEDITEEKSNESKPMALFYS